MATMYSRPATLIERIKGFFWRLKFRYNRYMAKGWEWQLPKEGNIKVKRIITEVHYEQL